jgi:hypothetical protein
MAAALGHAAGVTSARRPRAANKKEDHDMSIEEDYDAQGIPIPDGPSNTAAFKQFVRAIQGFDSVILRRAVEWLDPKTIEASKRQTLVDALVIFVCCAQKTQIFSDA